MGLYVETHVLFVLLMAAWWLASVPYSLCATTHNNNPHGFSWPARARIPLGLRPSEEYRMQPALRRIQS